MKHEGTFDEEVEYIEGIEGVTIKVERGYSGPGQPGTIIRREGRRILWGIGYPIDYDEDGIETGFWEYLITEP